MKIKVTGTITPDELGFLLARELKCQGLTMISGVYLYLRELKDVEIEVQAERGTTKAKKEQVVPLPNEKSCPKCRKKLERRYRDPAASIKPTQKYIYSQYDYCRACGFLQHYECFKVYVNGHMPPPSKKKKLKAPTFTVTRPTTEWPARVVGAAQPKKNIALTDQWEPKMGAVQPANAIQMNDKDLPF